MKELKRTRHGDSGQAFEQSLLEADLLFLTKLTVSSSVMPSLYVASQYPYTYVEPEPSEAIISARCTTSVAVRAKLTANRPRLPKDPASERNIIHLSALLVVPPGHNDSRRETILVFIAERLEERRDRVHGRAGVMLRCIKLGVVMNDVGDGLRGLR